MPPGFLPPAPPAGSASASRASRRPAQRPGAAIGAGRDLDETFGLIETAEKATEIYMKIAHLPLKNTIPDTALWQLADHFRVTPRAGFLAPRQG